MAAVKDQFVNTTAGVIGAVELRRGEPYGVPVGPGDFVWLSEEEQEVTANAHRDPKDNPFAEQEYVITDPATGDIKDQGRRAPLEIVQKNVPVSGGGRPIGRDQQAAQNGASGGEAPDLRKEFQDAEGEPDEPAPEGDFTAEEEVGTPDAKAPAAAARRRRSRAPAAEKE